MDWLQNILDLDTSLFLFLNGLHNDFWDTIMLMITRKETWFPFYAVLVYYFIRNYKSKAILILVFLGLVVLACDQFSVMLKYSVERLRPVYNPEIEHLVHNVLRKGGKFGFVSSHAANSFGIFIFTARIFKNKGYYFTMLFMALLVSYSRIYSGVHYPIDLIGGGLLGWFFAWLLFKIMMFFENRFFIARSPKISKTRLSPADFRIVLLSFVLVIVTFFITSGILHKYNYL